MSKYDDLLNDEKTKAKLSNMRKLSSIQLVAILKAFKQVPKDYLNFLKEVGNGTIGPQKFVIYNNLLTSEDIFSQEDSNLFKDILFF